MTPADTVDRARSAVGHGCDYHLGAGGMRPNEPHPWDKREGRIACDCSGFAMWAWGLSRFQKPVWFDTSRIVAEARYGKGLFEALATWADLKPGDGLVWGDRHGKQGHVGVVVSVDPVRVIHCSRGNWLKSEPKDAIQETDASVFEKNGALAVRCKLLTVPVGAGAEGSI